MNNNNFSVLDMVQEYASDNDINAEDLFKKDPVIETKEIPELDEDVTKVVEPEQPARNLKPKGPWVPDSSLTEGMDDLNVRPAIYDADEIRVEENTELKNIADDNALVDSSEVIEDLQMKNYKIEAAKSRFGISKLRIPEKSIVGGQMFAKIMAAAGDNSYPGADVKGLDEIFQTLVTDFPEFVYEWTDGRENQPKDLQSDMSRTTPIIETAEETVESVKQDNPVEAPDTPISFTDGEANDKSTTHIVNDDVPLDNVIDLSIVVNKSDLPNISFSEEDMEKIYRARRVKLDIVEDVKLRYSNIVEGDENNIDKVLSQYSRKMNDVSAPLPASRYRATFMGLTYASVLDLQYSMEMNNLDSERKKWKIAFDHLKNPSIGDWEDYKEYVNPETGKKVRIGANDEVPVFLNSTEQRINVKVLEFSKFDDFMMKTSYIDLEWILWKILCATTMDKEIITVECNGKQKNGATCGKSYDWVYEPNSLLITDSINPSVLEDMKETSEASSMEIIRESYDKSMLVLNNYVELPTSKIGVLFGHISAHEYLNSVYSEIELMEEMDNPMLSDVLSHTMLTVIKAFMVPEGDSVVKFSTTSTKIKIIDQRDEIDWQTLSELVRMMISPYTFRYALRGVKCPSCSNVSTIEIEDMSQLLFIVAQSLGSVQVELKQN